MKQHDDRLDAQAISIRDVLDAYKNYDCSDEAREPILYFVSELTGLSVDRILELA